MILTDELVHLLWVLIASLVWFYSVGLWSAIIRKAIQSHLQRTIVDRWKVLTDEREQKYEGAWISSSRFLHVWNDVWSPPECGCRSVWLMPSTPTFYPHFPLSSQLCSVGRSRKCPVRGTVGFHNCHLYPLEPSGFSVPCLALFHLSVDRTSDLKSQRQVLLSNRSSSEKQGSLASWITGGLASSGQEKLAIHSLSLATPPAPQAPQGYWQVPDGKPH